MTERGSTYDSLTVGVDEASARQLSVDAGESNEEMSDIGSDASKIGNAEQYSRVSAELDWQAAIMSILTDIKGGNEKVYVKMAAVAQDVSNLAARMENRFEEMEVIITEKLLARQEQYQLRNGENTREWQAEVI